MTKQILPNISELSKYSYALSLKHPAKYNITRPHQKWLALGDSIICQTRWPSHRIGILQVCKELKLYDSRTEIYI